MLLGGTRIAPEPQPRAERPNGQVMTHTIQLPDGRDLAFVDHGPQDGHPILFFHGTPASHPNWRFFGADALLEELDLRILAVDRPGIGRSSLQPDRTIDAWPEDIAALLEALNIPHAGILAHSLGGVYALACAVHMPERVKAVSLVGAGPPNFGSPFREGMVQSAYAFLELASKRPRAARLALRAMGAVTTLAPALFVRQAGGSLPPSDADLLDSEANRHAFLDMMRETLRAGPGGAQIDAALAYGPWDLPLESIRIPVDVWHGEQDRNVPVAVAGYYRDRIPTARLETFADDGHLSILARRGPRILRALRDHMQEGRLPEDPTNVLPTTSERTQVRP